MMLLTHGSSFLTDALVRTLNQHNFNYLVVTDDNPIWKPPADWRIKEHLLPTPLPDWFARNQQELEFSFCLDVVEDQAGDAHFRTLWQQCINHQAPLIFRTTPDRSAWVAQQTSAPFFWAGLVASHPFGPGDNCWTRESDKAFRGGEAPAHAWEGRRTLTYALNVAQAAYFLVHHRQQSGVYKLDGDQRYSFDEAAGWARSAHAAAAVLPSDSPPADLAELGCTQRFYSAEAGMYHYMKTQSKS